MPEFNHLSIFISIIIALGVSHLVSSGARLIHLRGRVRIHYPTVIWMVTLLLLQVQIWWVAFYRRDVKEWTFFGFLLYLLIPIVVSMLGYLLVPQLDANTDLENEYYHNRKWHFGLLAGVVAVSLLEDAVRSGMARLDLNFSMRVAFLVLCGVGVTTRAKRAQLPVALAFLGLFVFYMVLVFAKL